MSLSELAKNFSNADEAREFLEKQRWPSNKESVVTIESASPVMC